jgi:hypothetical protein
VEVLARAVALFAHVLDVQAGPAPRAAAAQLAVEVIAIAAGQAQAGRRVARRIGRQIVHHSADGDGTVRDLARALHDLDALEALDRRMVVRRVVAVRGVRDEQSVFEKQRLRGARGVEAADADVRPQRETLLVADVDARDLAERLVHVQHLRALERASVERFHRSGDALERLGAPRHARAHDTHVLGERAARELELHVCLARQLHVLAHDREAGYERADLVTPRRDLERETSLTVRLRAFGRARAGAAQRHDGALHDAAAGIHDHARQVRRLRRRRTGQDEEAAHPRGHPARAPHRISFSEDRRSATGRC